MLGLAAAFRPALRSGFHRLQIGPGDPRLIEYLVEHSWLFVLRRPGHTGLWDPPFFYPAPGVGAYTDTMLGAIAPYGPFRLLGLPPGLAFQLWMMSCLSLAFLATYLLLARGLGLGRWASATGAFLTGFGASRVASFNSPQLFTLFWGLFALYTLTRALEEAGDADSRRAPRWVVATAAFLVLQTWSAFYPAFFFGLALLIATAVALAAPRCRRSLLTLLARHPAACAAAAGGAVLAVLPMAMEHLAAVDELGWQSWRVIHQNLPPPSSWLYTGPRNLMTQWLGLARRFEPPGAPGQFSNGLGLVTTVAAGLGLVLERKRRIALIVGATALAVVVVATVWPGGGSLWRWVWIAVPGAGAIRYPARIGMLLTIAGSTGLALLLDRRPRVVPGAALIAVAAICLAEQLADARAFDDALYRSAVSRIADRIDSGCETFYLSRLEETSPRGQEDAGVAEKKKWIHLAAMWAALDAGVPTINGAAAGSPRGWDPLQWAGHRNEGRAALDAALAQWAEERAIQGRVCHIEEVSSRLPR
jgi:hypothetical protein